MQKLDPAFLSVLSDLFVNLAAGWLGTVIIVPSFTKEKGLKKILTLISNLLSAIVSLTIAVLLKKLL